MNIFFLDECPDESARAQHDKHVVKMILESAQLMCTAHHELSDPSWVKRNRLYRSTHKRHPMAIWVRQTSGNYEWLYRHFKMLLKEYRYRFLRRHSTGRLEQSLRELPDEIYMRSFRTPPACCPDQYKQEGLVETYREYYIAEKVVQSRWTRRMPPQWVRDRVSSLYRRNCNTKQSALLDFKSGVFDK